MRGEIILQEIERRKDLLNAHEADVKEVQGIQNDIAELQRQIDAKKADLDRVGAKVTQFDGGKIEAEIAELTDIAVELKIIEAPVVDEEVAVEEAVPTAEAVGEPQTDEVNQEEVATPVSLSDLL